jgi:hypothetical protein
MSNVVCEFNCGTCWAHQSPPFGSTGSMSLAGHQRPEIWIMAFASSLSTGICDRTKKVASSIPTGREVGAEALEDRNT